MVLGTKTLVAQVAKIMKEQQENEDAVTEWEMGKVYKNYICTKWDGTLSRKYTDTVLTTTGGTESIRYKYSLKKDKTYERETTVDDEVIYTEKGTYSIDGNEVTCTSDEGKKTAIFINIRGTTYFAMFCKTMIE